MERAEVISKLNGIFEAIIDDGPVSLAEDTTPDDVAGWDSLAHIQLIIAIEEGFDMRFTSDEILSWKNVGEMIDCLLAR